MKNSTMYFDRTNLRSKLSMLEIFCWHWVQLSSVQLKGSMIRLKNSVNNLIWNHLHQFQRFRFSVFTSLLANNILEKGWIIGPFIQGKIRRELYHLYEHVLSKTRTVRINGSHLSSFLDSWMLPVATAIQRDAPKINACVLCVRVLFKTRRSFIRSFSRLS